MGLISTRLTGGRGKRPVSACQFLGQLSTQRLEADACGLQFAL